MSNPKADAVEIDELCLSKRDNLWLWAAVSRYTGQILAWVIGSRGWEHLERLWSLVPVRWRRRLVYTDGYEAYSTFLSPWQHRRCVKGDGGTCTVEGVNTSLRARCGALVRRSGSRSGKPVLLFERVFWAVGAHNQAARERWDRLCKREAKRAQQRRQDSTQEKR